MDHLGALQTAPSRRRRKSALAKRATRLFPGVGTYVGRGKKGPADALATLEECTFDSPMQVSAPLRDGSLLIADERNGALRRVQAGKGIISTVPTQPSTSRRGARHNQLQSPICIDNGQALMMLDRQHHKVVMMQFKAHANSAATSGSATSWSGTPAEPVLRRTNSKNKPPSFGVRDIRMGSDERVLCDVAGTGAEGHVNGPAARAQFKSPSHLALLSDGSVLVSDTGNHVVRRIAGRPGRSGLYVSTVAGRPGLPGFQDGAGETAALHAPMGMAVDADGCILLVDCKNHAVRMLVPPPPGAPWDAPWGVHTVAGGVHLPDTLPAASSAAAKQAAKPQSALSARPRAGVTAGKAARGAEGTSADSQDLRSGIPGYRDGKVQTAMFKSPQGICFLRVPRSAYEAHVNGEYSAAEGGASGGSSHGRSSFMSDTRSVFSRSRSGSASSRSPRSRSASPKRELPGEELSVVTVALVADTGNGCIRMLGPALNISAVAASLVQGAMSHVPFNVRFAHVCSATGPRGVPLGTQLPADVAASKLGTTLHIDQHSAGAEHAPSPGGRTLPTQAMRAGKVQLVAPPKAGYCDGASTAAQFRSPTDVAVLPYAAFTGFPGQGSEAGVPDASEYAPPVVVVADRDNQLLRVLLPGWALTDDPPAPLSTAVRKCLAAKSAGSPQRQLGVQARVPGHIVPTRTGPSSMAVLVQKAASSGGVESATMTRHASPEKLATGGSSRPAASPNKGSPSRSIPSHMWVPHVARRDKKPYSSYKPEHDEVVARGKRAMRPPPNSAFYASRVSPAKEQSAAAGSSAAQPPPPAVPPVGRQSDAIRPHAEESAPPSPPMTLEALSQAPLDELDPPLELAPASSGTDGSAPHAAPPPPPAHHKPSVSFSASEAPREKRVPGAATRNTKSRGARVPRDKPQPASQPTSQLVAAGPMNALDALALANQLVDGSMASQAATDGRQGAPRSVVSAAMTASSRRGGGRGGNSAARAVRQMSSDFSMERLGASYETLQEEKRAKRKLALQRALANGPRPGVRDDSGVAAVRVAGLLGAQSSGAGGLDGALALASRSESSFSPEMHEDGGSDDDGFEYEQMLGARVAGRSGGVVYASAMGSHLDEEATASRQREQYEALVNALPSGLLGGSPKQGGGVEGGGSPSDLHESGTADTPASPQNHYSSQAVPSGTFAVQGTERYMRPTKAFSRRHAPSPASAARHKKEQEYQEYRTQRKAKLRLRETAEKRPWA